MPKKNNAYETDAQDSAPMVDPARLLRRKKIKGEELGRALLLSLVSDYHQRDSETRSPLFSQSDLSRMVSALPSAYERSIYQDYATLHGQLIAQFQQAQGLLQQLHHGMHRLVSRVSTAEKVFLLQKRIESLYKLEICPAFSTLPTEIHEIFPEDFKGIAERTMLQEELRSARDQLVCPAYMRITGYNAIVDIFANGLFLPDLRVLQISLKVVLLEGDGYDIMVERCLAMLPHSLAQPLREACPPLSLTRIRPNSDILHSYVHAIQQQGPAGCHLPTAIDVVMHKGQEDN